MAELRERLNRRGGRALAVPAEDLTADVLRLAVSGVTLAVAVLLTLVS